MSDQQDQYPPYQYPQYPQGEYMNQPPPYYVPIAPDGRPLAGAGQRLGARFLDGLIIILAFVPVIGVIVGGMAALTNSVIDDDSPAVPAILIPAIVLAVLAVNYLYEVELVLRWNGQTPGKRALKIAIAPMDPQTPLSRRVLFYRLAVTFAFNLLSNCYVGFLDPLWLLWDKPYKQTLHDKAAKTVVVKVEPVQAFGATESSSSYPTVR